MDEFNIGDIVRISEEGYTYKWLGKISDPKGQINYTWSKKANPEERIPIMFPQAINPHWFYVHNCRHATENERKTYFKDLLHG